MARRSEDGELRSLAERLVGRLEQRNEIRLDDEARQRVIDGVSHGVRAVFAVAFMSANRERLATAEGLQLKQGALTGDWHPVSEGDVEAASTILQQVTTLAIQSRHAEFVSRGEPTENLGRTVAEALFSERAQLRLIELVMAAEAAFIEDIASDAKRDRSQSRENVESFQSVPSVTSENVKAKERLKGKWTG